MKAFRANSSSSISAAMAAQAQFLGQLDALTRQLSLRAAETLSRWAVPEPVVVSSLLVPLVELQAEQVRTVVLSFDPHAIDLAMRLVDWHRKATAAYQQIDPAASYDAQLRYLFRECYLELANDLDFILLLLADHDARLGLIATPSLCKQTLAVFVPLVEMLGIWSLRRVWLDQSMALLEPTEYHRIEFMLAAVTLRKEAAFVQLQHDFVARAQVDGFSSLPQLQPTETPPGTGLRRFREGRSEEEFVERLVVRIVCETINDCYTALGTVHSLGRPVGPRFAGRFDDYIASPEPNGYRALYTAIRYTFRDETGHFLEIVVEVRILTHHMHDLNEWGIVKAFHQSEGCFKEVQAWWNQVSDLDNELMRQQFNLQRESSTAPCPTSTQPSNGLHELLTHFDIGSFSNPIYVFSPRGQLFLLPAGSTPLDFAYRVHTDIGNCVERMDVNGRSALLQQPLRNGDCVRIHRGSACIGPDLTWVTWAATPYARSKIRRALARQAREIHEGRLGIEEALFRRIQYYKQKKGYELMVTRRDLDAFLLEKAKSRHMHNVTGLYNEVVSRKLLPERLIWQLISQELACALVDREGRQLVYPLHRVSLCDACRPVPGESIVAYIRSNRGSAENLVVHNRDCPQQRGSGQIVDIQWAEPSRWRTLADIRILADDRAGLLGEIIDAVYEQPKVYLHRTAARTYSDGNADITLMVMVEDLHQLSELQARLERLQPVRQVSSFPASQAWVRTLAAVHSEWVPNPYTSDEVFDHEHFYDRHPQIETIQRWLAQKRSGPLILHGQRKTGKSSLIRYLKREVLFDQRDVLPVVVNLQALTGYVDMQKLAATLLALLHWDLPRDMPTMQIQPDNEDPAVSFMQALRHTTQFLQERFGQRLLLMVDEFDVLVRKQVLGELAPDTLRSLRAIMNERRDMFWLLVVADGNFYDTNAWGSAGPLFQQAQKVQIAELGAEWAWRLILEGVHLCRLRYKGGEERACGECFQRLPARMPCDDCLPGRILRESAGMPFFIQLICHDLVERARNQRRSIITNEDLNHVTNVLLSDGKRIFDHYLRHLDDSHTGPIRRAIITAVAERTSPGEWMPYGELESLFARKGKEMRLALDPNVQRLKNLGMIGLIEDHERGTIRIFPPLFHRWVTLNLPLV